MEFEKAADPAALLQQEIEAVTLEISKGKTNATDKEILEQKLEQLQSVKHETTGGNFVSRL